MAIRPLLWAKDQTVITSGQRRKNGELVTSKPGPSTLDKLVLIGIADEASEKTWDALIGVEDLAVFAGCTRRAIQESLGRLERAGYIRCRDTQVESGQSGWRRIYLLSADSPLFQGLIEVDFSTVEQVSRYQMRTFRDREKATFIPSDSLRYRCKPPAHGQGERGSHSPQGSANEVHTQGANEVHTEGERGSHPEGERGSHPSFSSSGDFSPDPESRTEETSSEEEPANRKAAIGIRARLDLSKVKAQPAQTRQIEEAVERLLDLGFTETTVERHAQRKLAVAKTCKYLLQGLAPEYVTNDEPSPGPAAAPSKSVAWRWCRNCRSETCWEPIEDGARCSSCGLERHRTETSSVS